MYHTTDEFKLDFLYVVIVVENLLTEIPTERRNVIQRIWCFLLSVQHTQKLVFSPKKNNRFLNLFTIFVSSPFKYKTFTFAFETFYL